MKALIYFSVILISLSVFHITKSQEAPSGTLCGTPDSTIVFNGPIGTATINVVFVFLDFPDGRLQNGEIPSTDGELNDVENLDAVLNMGFVTTNGINYTQKVRKYTYSDFWNMYFSVNTFIGTAHPDWNSHGAYGFPPDRDTARAWGSFKEYFSAVSYGKLTINAPVTHQNETGIYRTGIVNDIIEVNGVKYIKPIKLPLKKSQYGTNPDFDMIRNAAHNLLINNNEIEFNLLSHLESGGKVIYVCAGGTTGDVGGTASTNEIVLREKRVRNNLDATFDNWKIINGLTIYCHEFGHTIGFSHSGIGNYCAMSEGTSNQNCPSHFNIIYKLKAGWIDPQYVRFIGINQTVTDLPPSEYHGDCAILTIYGKPGYSEPPNSPPNYNHSEYYVIENRRMLLNDPLVKFDKKFVWQWHLGRMPAQGFNGGALITHYSNYNLMGTYRGIKIKNADPDTQMEVTVTDEGHSNHFFGSPRLNGDPFTFITDNDNNVDRTKSSFNLKTGIKITSINDPGNGTIGFTLNYSLGVPAVYDRVFYGQTITSPIILDGLYFIHSLITSQDLTIQPGCILESPGNGTIQAYRNFTANGTQSNHISFIGCGFSTYRTAGGNNFKVNSEINQNLLIKYCDFTNSDVFINIQVRNSTSPVSLSDLHLNNNGTITYRNENCLNTFEINNINFEGSQGVLYLISDNANPHDAKLTALTNSNFSEYNIIGPWQFDFEHDFEINTGAKLKVVNIAGADNTGINFTTPYKIIINGISDITGNFKLNRDLYITQSGLAKFTARDKPTQPAENFVKFSSGYGIVCDGRFDASATNDSLYFTVNGTGQWNGIKCNNNGSFIMNKTKVRNANVGVEMNKPTGLINIQNCRFSDNRNYDILLNNLQLNGDATRQLKNNIFTGNPNKLASVYCNNGVDITIEDNEFDSDYNIGIALLWMTNPVVKQNTMHATTNGGYSPLGVLSYSSGGFYSCNDITNYSNGVQLDNSSPYIFNNDMFNNGIGLYCLNSSNPILSPSYSPGTTLYTGGYNRIFNNLNAEIYCNNNLLTPYSLPVLADGNNSIYDGNQDCLIDLGTISLPYEYNVQNNYWGGQSPQNRLCPQTITFAYVPYLVSEPEPPPLCQPYTENSGNGNMSQSTLLLGSANLDDFNGNLNSAVNKYKNLVVLLNNPAKSYLALSKIFYSTSKDTNADFYSLENYYLGLSNQYFNDTLFRRKASNISTSTDVEQPSFVEALSEYQQIINSPLNEIERHYAYIDKMRTARLMLDSLLRGGGDNQNSGNNYFSNYEFKMLLEELLNFKIDNKKNPSKESSDKIDNNGRMTSKYLSTMTSADKNRQINLLKQNLTLDNLNFNNLTNAKKVQLLNNIICYKLFEYAVVNHLSNERPLDRMEKNRIRRSVNKNIPKQFHLYQNYPNPFNPISSIKFDIPTESKVQIRIFDLLGREVQMLVNEIRKPGYYEVYFNGSNFASGVYFYRIEAGNYIQSKKMVFIK